MKKYVLYVSYAYCFPILRPIQDEIRRRGDDAAWFFEKEEDSKQLKPDEKHLKSIKEVFEYDPFAVLVPSDDMYDFLPGIKVQVFHGLIDKRNKPDEYFRIRGYFDLYCTPGNERTPGFKKQEEKYGFFKVIETGWSKMDYYTPIERDPNQRTTVMYASTFSRNMTSTVHLYDTIERLIQEKDWDWLITLHPKLDQSIIDRYKALTRYTNVKFDGSADNVPLMQKADVMLCDSSSIVTEFLWFDKPVVTFRNINPGNYLIDVNEIDKVEGALEEALTRPTELMQNIRRYIDWLHPYRDGKSSGRILDAIDEFDKKYKGKLKKKPLNIIRKLKMRKKAGYYPFGPKYSLKK